MMPLEWYLKIACYILYLYNNFSPISSTLPVSHTEQVPGRNFTINKFDHILRFFP